MKICFNVDRFLVCIRGKKSIKYWFCFKWKTWDFLRLFQNNIIGKSKHNFNDVCLYIPGLCTIQLNKEMTRINKETLTVQYFDVIIAHINYFCIKKTIVRVDNLVKISYRIFSLISIWRPLLLHKHTVERALWFDQIRNTIWMVEIRINWIVKLRLNGCKGSTPAIGV